LIPVKPRKYRLGHGEWHRTTGNVLRPHAYPEEEIERLKRTQFSPPFELFYQQGLRSRATQKINAEHFQSFGQFQFLPQPVVLSIDPATVERQRAAVASSRFGSTMIEITTWSINSAIIATSKNFVAPSGLYSAGTIRVSH
jgi:hypothetical protein